MKYIDAEDLQVIIEKRINNIESCPFIEAEFGAEMRREGKILAYNDILTLIDSLQQEQPDKESLNESQQEFVDIVTERMLKEGPIPTLKGKQKVEFEKEFNRFKQITGMINFPAHMEVYKRVILWFMAWGADNLPNLGKPIDPGRMDIQQEQPEVNFEKELKNERAKLLDAFGPMNGEQSLAIRNFAHHFYECGQIEMRRRITNPEYNAKVVEQLKSEYPARKEE